MSAELMKDMTTRMDGAIAALSKEFSGLRTGRASADLLEPVTVEAYGAMSPLTQVGNVNVPDARRLSVQVWDKTLVPAVEKAIRESGLGLNPSSDGDTIFINLPDLTEERRADLIKVARKYAENARVSIRNVRRDGMDTVKKQKAASEITEDDQRRLEGDIQKITDDKVAFIDTTLESKEKDIMTV